MSSSMMNFKLNGRLLVAQLSFCIIFVYGKLLNRMEFDHLRHKHIHIHIDIYFRHINAPQRERERENYLEQQLRDIILT